VWYFVAECFADYYRLLIMHLGLPHWHAVFTDAGLDPVSMQWARFVCPERLGLDLMHARRKDAAADDVPRGNSDREGKPRKAVRLQDLAEVAVVTPKITKAKTENVRSSVRSDAGYGRPATAFIRARSSKGRQ
jgi:hypothetical protein